MSHLKRQQIPKQWPIGRKGSVYVVKSKFGTKDGVPVLIALRDMLKIVKDRKEAKQTIHNRHILLNEKPVIDEKNTILLFEPVNFKTNLASCKTVNSSGLPKFTGSFSRESIKRNIPLTMSSI